MSPLASSKSPNQSPTTSITPPSETTLNNEEDVSESIPSLSWAQFHEHTDMDKELHSRNRLMESLPRSQMPSAINTDYESSATEDFESFTSSKYENAEYALLSYARTNKIEKLQILLESKARNEIILDLNFKGQQKQNFSWSALHLACYFGHIKVVELLLSRKIFCNELDINIQNISGDTPLHKATFTDRAQIVQLLLSKDANVFIKNCDGLLAKHLTRDQHILNMLEAAEQVDRNRTIQAMFKAVDNGDLKKLQEYFENYESNSETPKTTKEPVDGSDSEVVKDAEPPESGPHQNKSDGRNQPSDGELISRMTDERGNTLLHLAAMRGFKAICVYLLEQGFDPYKKNHLGQSSIDLSSYQLRQLFTTVKPANSQLKKMTNHRVTRFEGPLLKKVRILGWRQIYVVLENGVILLFNNRRDSMNKSRRGYKYLESATCEPDANDLGTFTVSFSDRSRATFLVTTDHLNNYTSFKTADLDRNVSPTNQIDLIRQKWIDSIRDHIKYSTEFIRNGLKFNDYDEENDVYNNDGDLASLNHLLPIDTIKSFMQEARAHYSILDRHAESLCNLIQSIIASNRQKQQMSPETEEEAQNIDQTAATSTSTTTTTGNRLLNFIRPSRQQARQNSVGGDDLTASYQPSNSSSRKRNDSMTNEFLQDNWHCILFHLRLLMESTENTKVSMGQALGLIEHQEQLRQNRIQDQEERCRVLEDSLHALARDHHELEKSISMSQIYHSAAGGMKSLSISMSTDLNEYFDAFEDFDEAANSRTLTPTSMPTDENLDLRIQEVIDETNRLNESNYNDRVNQLGDISDEDEDDDDLRSNCSALTVETVSELSVATIGNRLIRDGSINTLINDQEQRSRTRLPSPMVPRDQVSIWSILKNCIGKELSKITMPVVFNEPLTMLQRACECMQFSRYLKMADESDDPIERMEMICTFIVAGLSANCHRIIKPFNPLLYETFEYDHELEDGSHVRALAQQVSHHPPITAAYGESENFIYNGSVNPKIKFWGRSIEVQPDGQCRIYLKRHKETYIFKSVTCSVHNIIVGKLWFEHKGPLDIKCVETNVQANLNFRQAGWFSNDLHRFDGHIVSPSVKETKKVRFIYGKWSDYIKSVDYSEYENYMKESQQKIFKIPDTPYQSLSNGLGTNVMGYGTHGSANSINNNSISNTALEGDAGVSGNERAKAVEKSKGAVNKSESSQSLDIPNSRTLWSLESQYLEEYYNFTHFTMKLNELTSDLAKILPRTDSRFRPDVRKLEEGDLDGAASEKQRLEEKQREARARDKRFKDPSPDLLWFDLKDVKPTKEKFWLYKGGYWESKCNPEKFPDLF